VKNEFLLKGWTEFEYKFLSFIARLSHSRGANNKNSFEGDRIGIRSLRAYFPDIRFVENRSRKLQKRK
jgi:hypothetical protein